MRNNLYFINQYLQASINKLNQVIKNVQEIQTLESWKEAKINANVDIKEIQKIRDNLQNALNEFVEFKENKKIAIQEEQQEKAKKAEERFLKQAEKFGYKITKKA